MSDPNFTRDRKIHATGFKHPNLARDPYIYKYKRANVEEGADSIWAIPRNVRKVFSHAPLRRRVIRSSFVLAGLGTALFIGYTQMIRYFSPGGSAEKARQNWWRGKENDMVENSLKETIYVSKQGHMPVGFAHATPRLPRMEERKRMVGEQRYKTWEFSIILHYIIFT